MSPEARAWLIGYNLELIEEIEDDFGFHISIGFDINLNENVCFNADYKYVYLKPTLNGTLTDLSTSDEYYRTEEIDLGVKGFNAGLSLIF